MFYGIRKFITTFTRPVPERNRSSPCPHLTYQRSILILSSHLHLGLPSGLLHTGFPTETMYAPLLVHICATCPTHLSLLDWITRVKYLVTNTEHEALRYVVPLLPCYLAQIIFSAPSSRKPSAYILPSMSTTQSAKMFC